MIKGPERIVANPEGSNRSVPISGWLKITGPNLLEPLNQRKRLNNQAVWPVILRLTGPICARAPK